MVAVLWETEIFHLTNLIKLNESYQRGRCKEVHENHVQLETVDGMLSINNDAVIINAGGILPTGFLKSIGIEVETKYGTA